MRIVFLTLVYPSLFENKNLYSDLIDEIASRGNEVIVFRSDESRYFGKASEEIRNGVQIVNIPTGKITKTGRIEKALNFCFLNFRFQTAILRYLKSKIDLIIYSTPPVTFEKVVETLKKKFFCRTYLLLKDIFPQNSIDLGMMRQGSFVHGYFRNIEKRLYATSDYIGCMSPANVQYLLEHNPEISNSKVHVNPNSICPTPMKLIPVVDKSNLDRYGIPKEKFHLVYGGNLGEPQGIAFILEVLTVLSTLQDVNITIVGDGTQYKRIAKYILETELKNVTLIKSIPKKMYKELLRCMDIGLVFLDKRFTIPNFPSRVLDYMDMSLPIIAATDDATDIGHILIKAGAGLMCKSVDTEEFLKCVKILKDDDVLRKNMAKASRALLINEYSTTLSADNILSR